MSVLNGHCLVFYRFQLLSKGFTLTPRCAIDIQASRPLCGQCQEQIICYNLYCAHGLAMALYIDTGAQ